MAFSLTNTIVEATKTKASLVESEERFRTIIEYSHSGIFTINNAFQFTYLNDQACRIVGYSREELLGMDFRQLLDDESKARVVDSYIRLQRGESIPVRYEMSVIRKDGEKRILEMSAASTELQQETSVRLDRCWTSRTVSVWSTKPKNVASTLKVSSQVFLIDDRKKAEYERENLIKELETRNAELERFIYTVSHDLRSPLVTIRGFLGYMEKNLSLRKTDQIKEDMGRITMATNKMQRMLNELLELSRVGRMTNPYEDVDFTQLVHEAVELVRIQIEARGIQVNIADYMPPAYGDRARLLEVIQNLLDNACKFLGDQREPVVDVGFRGSGPDNGPIYFVRDNGIGIDPQFHERVFGIFNKLDIRTDGTGVGLALVKRIIEEHRGKIWIESQGKSMGSTFCFTLPPRPN